MIKKIKENFSGAIILLNSIIFYTIIIEIIGGEENQRILNALKIIFLIVIIIYSIYDYKIILKSNILILIILIGLFGGIYRNNTIFVTVIPVLIGGIINQIGIDKFQKNILISSLIFTLLFLIFNLFYRDVIIDYSNIKAVRSGFDFGLERNLTREGLGFKTPNNIAIFANFIALIAVIQRKNLLFILYITIAFTSFYFTNSRGGLLSSIAIVVIYFTYKNLNKFKGFDTILLLLISFLPIFLPNILDADIFNLVDRLSSHRFHYVDILFEFSILPNQSGYTLDSSLISFLNITGIITTVLLIYVIIKTSSISIESHALCIGFLIIGIFENIINQYLLWVPMIYSYYLTSLQSRNYQYVESRN